MKNKYMKIKSIVIVIILITLYSIFIVVYSTYVKSNITNETYVYLSEVANQGVKVVNTKISGDFKVLESISTYIGSHDDFDLEHNISALRKETKKSLFKRMGIISLDGLATMTDGYTYNLSDRKYFKEALNGKTTISDKLVDKVDGKAINVYATPIYNNENEIISVLFATHNTIVYKELLEVSSFGGNGYSYIIKSNGEPAVYSRHKNSVKEFDNIFDILSSDLVKSDISINNMKENIKKGKDGYLSYVYHGSKRIMNYKPIGINDWYIATVIPSIIVSQKSNDIIKVTFIVCIIIIFTFGILLVYILLIERKTKKNIEKIAFEDVLTGYPNWNKFKIDCKEILINKINEEYVVISLDIDRFKFINDIFGRNKGDIILKYIANTINESIKLEERFSRIASDKFVILMKYENKEKIINRIKIIEQKINTYDSSYHIILSMGIYNINDKTLDISTMFDRANIAKSTIKNKSENTYAFYTDKIRDIILNERQIENCMEKAVINKEFEMYLQPKYLFENETIIGAEALVRWNHPDKGFIQPIEFISIFEKNGFIMKLDMYMFEEVCIFLENNNINMLDLNRISISVNLSNLNLRNSNLVSNLEKIVQKYNIKTNWIEIELTESIVFDNIETLVSVMDKLKELGFKIAIDDFGSGYSSLNILRKLPVDSLKIDKGFLEESSGTNRGKIIIENILHMAKDLNLSTIAEGVETIEQVEFLKEKGCDIAQGYYYDKPMDVHKFEKKYMKIINHKKVSINK